MSGRNAKTNFPITQTPNGDPKFSANDPSSTTTSSTTNSNSTAAAAAASASASAPNGLSEILHAKLRKCSKTPSPSMTYLSLDTKNSAIFRNPSKAYCVVQAFPAVIRQTV